MVSVLSGGVLISWAVSCVLALADGPSGGFQMGYRACLCLLGLSWLQASCAGFCGGCPASFSFPWCSALERLSARQIVTVTWDPHPREPVEGVLRATSMLESTAYLASWAVFSGFRSVGSLCLVQTPGCYFGNPFLGTVCGGTRVYSCLTSWSVRGAGWFCLWALDLVEVCAEGCFHIVFDSAGSAGVVLGWTLVVGHGISLFRCFVALYSRLTPLLSSVAFLQVLRLFEFIAYLTGLNSNPSGSSDPWVAARPSGSLVGGPGGQVITAWMDYGPVWMRRDYWESLCHRWATGPWLERSQAAKRNRVAHPKKNVHTSGLVSYATHSKKLETYDRTMVDRYAEGTPQPDLDLEAWVDAVGVPRKGRVYRFGDNLNTTPVLFSYSSLVAPPAYASSSAVMPDSGGDDI
ncbi:hypothetical protein Taro_006699 [Colocasia esculenta]|uniref:Uncharacterized protein n=1 Tax=Colocasia esculenta TaxID=4460 RepID=A0A843TPF5_COLES|nr:hypothetical protein [Colocasia esculenta]